MVEDAPEVEAVVTALAVVSIREESLQRITDWVSAVESGCATKRVTLQVGLMNSHQSQQKLSSSK